MKYFTKTGSIDIIEAEVIEQYTSFSGNNIFRLQFTDGTTEYCHLAEFSGIFDTWDEAWQALRDQEWRHKREAEDNLVKLFIMATHRAESVG